MKQLPFVFAVSYNQYEKETSIMRNSYFPICRLYVYQADIASWIKEGRTWSVDGENWYSFDNYTI